MVAVVSRLTFQKGGINLILDELYHILNMKVQLVVLGSGELKYEYAFREMEHNYKHQAVFLIVATMKHWPIRFMRKPIYF